MRKFILCITGADSIYGNDFKIIVGTDNSWLRRKYPTFEHFELITPKEFKIDELQTFSEQNVNLKRFATSLEKILENKNAFVNIQLNLDVLSVNLNFSDTFSSSADFLNEL